MRYFVFIVMQKIQFNKATDQHETLYLVDKEKKLFSFDPNQKQLMTEAEASDIATDVGGGCGSL